ncbi:hypothetical protein BC829DRAFT_385537, partial [Chytridium lagenaria]
MKRVKVEESGPRYLQRVEGKHVYDSRQEEAKLKRRRKKAGKEGNHEMVKADAVAAAAATSCGVVCVCRGHGPQVQVVNGVITLDTSSLMVSAADAVLLAWFGSDFNMILQLFPELTRRHLKLKFDKEERTNRSRIDEVASEPSPEILEEMRENQMRRAEERQA